MRFYRDDLPPTIADLIEIERKEGIKEGEENSKKDIALTMINEGYEVDYISKLTKLSVAEVKNVEKLITFNDWIEIGRKKGYEKGLLLGKEKVINDFVLTLIHEGFEVDYISKLSKLTVAEVNKLKESL